MGNRVERVQKDTEDLLVCKAFLVQQDLLVTRGQQEEMETMVKLVNPGLEDPLEWMVLLVFKGYLVHLEQGDSKERKEREDLVEKEELQDRQDLLEKAPVMTQLHLQLSWGKETQRYASVNESRCGSNFILELKS